MHRRLDKIVKIKIVIVILLIISGILVFLELRLKPVTRSVASIQAKSFATLAINETTVDILEEMHISSEDLETVTVSSDGVITSISTNTVTVNKLKNLITIRTQNALANIKNKRVDIPLGTLFGGEILNGIGPGIPVHISMSGNVNTDFEEEFETGGINQTVHKLSVKITADITIVMPMTSCSEKVMTTILVGETVIVGNTPGGMIMHDFQEN